MKVISVVGARPNFMKIAPFIREVEKHEIEHVLVHTGQHYDDKMSLNFFKDLNIPIADINLEVGSGTHAEQVGKTMIAFEKILQSEQPDWVVVVGDVNATLACSVTAKKMNIKVCHIESGLRSRDESMPEEINRLVTDRLSDLLLTPDEISTQNLKDEGVSPNRIKFVGNIMIDTLDANINKVKKINLLDVVLKNHITQQPNKKIKNLNSFGVITLHRPSNVDSKEILSSIVSFFSNCKLIKFPLIWVIHPRTENKLKEFNLWDLMLMNNQIIMLNPLRYHDMLKLNLESKVMFTDSGGLQEECMILGTPCVTLRWNTERPVTLLENGGVSILVGNNAKTIENGFSKVIDLNIDVDRPKYWDGQAAARCLKWILNYK